MDKSAAKKAAKRRRKRNSKKNKIKATSPPSDTSYKSGLDEDVILISEDSDDAVNSNTTQYSIFDISISEDSEDVVNVDSTENQEEQLSDDHDSDEIDKEPSDNVEDVSRQHIVMVMRTLLCFKNNLKNQ